MVESAGVWSGSDLGRVGAGDVERAARLLGQRPEGLERSRTGSSHGKTGVLISSLCEVQ